MASHGSRNRHLYFIEFGGWIALLVVGFQLYPLARLDAASLAQLGTFPDLAYDYVAVATQLARDGWHAFSTAAPDLDLHPLWLRTQLGLRSALGATNGIRLLAVSAAALYIVFTGLALITLRGKRRRGGPWAMGLFVLLIASNAGFQSQVVQGLETTIGLVLLVALLVTLESRRSILVRARAARENGIATRAPWFAHLLAGIALLLTAGWIFALVPLGGHVEPRYLDVTAPVWVAPFRIFDEILPVKLPLSVSVIWGGGLFVFAHLLLWTGYVRSGILRWIGLVLLVHWVGMQLFYPSLPASARYLFAPELVWTLLVLSRGFARLALAHQSVGWVIFAGALFTTVSFASMESHRPEADWVQRVRIAQQISRFVPEDHPVGSFQPSFFAAFSSHPILPLQPSPDGAAPSDQFSESHRIFQPLLGNGPAYLVIALDAPPDQHMAGPDPLGLSRQSPGSIHLWNLRARISVDVLARRPLDEWGGGWYLVELRADESRNVEWKRLELPADSAENGLEELFFLCGAILKQIDGTNERIVDFVTNRNDSSPRPMLDPRSDRSFLHLIATATSARESRIRIALDRLRSRSSSETGSATRLYYELLPQVLDDYAKLQIIGTYWEIFSLEIETFEEKAELQGEYDAALRTALSESGTDLAATCRRLHEEFSARESPIDKRVRREYGRILDRMTQEVAPPIDLLKKGERFPSPFPEGAAKALANLEMMYSTQEQTSPLLSRTLFCLHPVMYEVTGVRGLNWGGDVLEAERASYLPQSWDPENGTCWSGANWVRGLF